MLSKPVLIECYFLPPIAWFSEIHHFDTLILDIESKYIKQSYRNRAIIKTANGMMNLTVPIAGSQQINLKYIKIDYKTNWQANLWRSIISAYNKSPYFEYYKDDLEKILFTKYEFLYELNISLIHYFLKCLKLKMEVTLTIENDINDIFDKRKLITNKPKSLNNMEERSFKIYKQVFGNQFDSNLSILDLLSCCGPNSNQFLEKSETIH